MVVLVLAVEKAPLTVSACHSGAIVTLTAVAAVGTFLMVTSCSSIVLRCRPSVTVFVPPSTSVAVACAAIRSPCALPSFRVMADVLVPSLWVGSV